MLSSTPDYINDLREVQHYLLKQADYHFETAYRLGRLQRHGIAVGYRNAYNRVSELLEQWEKQHANHPS